MNTTKPNIYLIPRWAATIHSDWYDWLVMEIKNKYQIEILRLEMPDWNQADIKKSTQFLIENIPELNNNTYFIGHSVGCLAILHFLNKQFKSDEEIEIGGFLFVAGWFEVDKPWISLKSWFNTESLDFPLLSKQIGFKKVIISDNDPFTSNYHRNKSLWKDYLNVDVSLYHDKLHFNQSKEMEVLKEIEEMISYALK